MDELSLSVLRAIDKADRRTPLEVFDLLLETGVSGGQALVLVSLAFSTREPEVSERIRFFLDLEKMEVEDGGTGIDIVLELYESLPEPKSLSGLLDSLLRQARERYRGARQ